MIRHRTICFLILLFSHNIQAASPIWFGDAALFPVKNSYQYIEFSTGNSFEEARENARSAIAAAIRVQVKSETITSDLYDSNVSKSSFQRLATTSVNVVLNSPIKILKEGKSEGITYLAVSYDATPSILRLKNLTTKKCYRTTPYFIQFEKSLRLTDDNCLPDFRLNAGSGFWQLIFQENKISIDKNLIQRFFYPFKNENLVLNHSQIRVRPFQAYFIELKIAQPGYLSLIQLYQNGQSAVLLENQKLISPKIFTFPDKKTTTGLINVLPDEDQQNRDLTIALLCQQQLDLSPFSTLSTTNTDNYREVSADFLFRQSNCELATEVIVTSR